MNATDETQQIAALKTENQRLRGEYNRLFDELTFLKDRLALYDSCQEMITTPTGRVWVAAEKHEAVTRRLHNRIEVALRFANHPDIADRTEALEVLHDIREALAK